MNGAIIKVSKRAIAEMLGYKGGVIHAIREPEYIMNPGEIDIYMEHPELPKIEEHERLGEVMPVYEVKYYKNGRYSFRRHK